MMNPARPEAFRLASGPGAAQRIHERIDPQSGSMHTRENNDDVDARNQRIGTRLAEPTRE